MNKAKKKKIQQILLLWKPVYQGVTQESWQFFFFLLAEGDWTIYWFSLFLNTVNPLNLVI